EVGQAVPAIEAAFEFGEIALKELLTMIPGFRPVTVPMWIPSGPEGCSTPKIVLDKSKAARPDCREAARRPPAVLSQKDFYFTIEAFSL
ncbi:MAG: hypothetical protein OXF73_10425, partial [Gammaproteobacteria bacterium]|nr:hypothetical protein [Gammaproteobacteria bacterium]